ncbi:TonB-dependent receptor plug domain-containing protein [Mailhella sp.]|uniref:TonB-dependent receptor plug domain-containing protein n=1 Tax=Mailhella sp. TaxID=1981029 RepID=UPI0040643E7D
MQRNFKKFAKFAVLCGLAVGLMAHPAFATDAPVRTTEKVIVTAGRIAEKAKTVTQNVTVLDEEFIQKNQHKSLDKVLAQQGVQIMGNGEGTSSTMRVTLRGQRSTSDDMNSGHVMVLVDGQRTALTALNMIPMVSIARVEVLRGPAAVQYGSMAFGGVVNIITKRGTEQTQATLEIGGGSFETWKGMAGVSGMVGDVDYSFGFSHALRNEGFKDGDGNRLKNSEIGGQTTWAANVGYNFLDEHRIGVSFIGSNFDRLGDWGGTYDMSNNLVASGSDTTTYDDRKNYALGIAYEGGSKANGLSWMAKYNRSEEYNAYCSVYSPFRMDSKNDNAVAQLSWKYSFLTMTGGLEYNKSQVEKKAASYPLPKYELSNISAFLLGKTAFFNDKLVFSVGARYDDYEAKVTEKRSDENFSLSAGAAYSPWDWLTFRANVGESFRMPTGLEVVGFETNEQKIEGNPNLDPETGLGWDFGFEVAHKGFKAGLTYFAMDYEDKIVTEGNSYKQWGGGDARYVNRPGTTKFRGLEGNISYDLGEAFGWDFMIRPYANFTHMLDYEEPDGTDAECVRDWVAAFGINYSHPSIGLDVDLSCTYLGEQRESYTYGNPDQYHGDNYIVDLGIVKTLYETDDMGKLSAKLDLHNIFDEQYHYAYGYPMPGRSFFLSLIWNY